MKTIDLLKDLNVYCHFMSRERSAPATMSEMKRWCDNKSVKINGICVGWNDHVDFPIESLILFPRHPVTIK